MDSSSPNTSAGVTQQHHEESPPAPAVDAPDHTTPAPTTSASSPGDEKPTATATEAPKEAPSSKTTVEDANEDEDSEFDELDDVLDNFSKPTPQPIATAPAPASAPAPANEDIDEDAFMRQLEQDMAKMMNHAAQESGAPDNKEFENAINQGADAFTKQLEESGIPPGDFLKQLLADVMAEEGEGAGAAAAAAASASASAGAGPSTGGPSGSATGAGKAAAPESFNDAIQRTIHRMKESGDKATAAATEDGGISEDMLMQLLKGLEAGVGNGGDDLDLTQMIAGVMEQFSNKEMLYEPMKELDAKWGPWLKDNKGKVPAEDMERYEKQAKLVTEIVAKFEEEGYTDEDPKYRQAVWDKMQEMQALGSPPEELVANPWPEDVTGGDGSGAALPDCPQQ
ncbi:peroxisome chaperone and import receptor [Aspergillus pseudoviridinutans]|uniref:Peroxisome chaperone and import receptor n=1 Tax=Aspergillus pseudoviridinutans TaxID=1517512 RepID=A0A9P3ETT9_9EURO|nr:peroxisome chaperone and import receptor [Aspergillus pseudoviridinutans]GIJ87714.1 peroxisome chaperone and import receptor [Aspergillus pseudoviridinutans]